MSRIRKAITFSNVIAVIALFLALGGSVYAASNKISGKQIKPRSLPGNRLKPKSVTAKEIKANVITGKQVKAESLTDKQVVGSSLTGVSATGLSNVHYASVTVTLAGYSFSPAASASCPSGQKVIGGGVTFSDDKNADLNASGPTSDNTGWTARAWTSQGGTTMTVTAICVSVSAPTSSEVKAGGPFYGVG